MSRMTYNEVTIAARNDTIIVKIGEKLFQKHGHLPQLYSHVSQKMRELGRFLVKLRETDQDIKSMNCVINPEKYPIAVKATRLLCNYEEGCNKFKNPSLALKLGHLQKKCAKIKKFQSLTDGHSEQGQKAFTCRSRMDQ